MYGLASMARHSKGCHEILLAWQERATSLSASLASLASLAGQGTWGRCVLSLPKTRKKWEVLLAWLSAPAQPIGHFVDEAPAEALLSTLKLANSTTPFQITD